jgi:tight adherence protein B
MSLLILGAVFIGTLSLIVGLFIFVNRRRLSAGDAARRRLHPEMESVAARGILKDESVSDVPLLNRLMAGRSFAGSLATRLEMAGSPMTPGGFVVLTLATTLVGLVVGLLLGRTPITILLVVIGALLPWLWLRRKGKKRIQQFEAQLPEAIDMMVTAMKSGYSFQAAMRFIGQEMAEPLGPEFTRFYDEQRLGVEVRTALLSMQERIRSLDFKMLVTAVLIQRETGGSLSDILGNISKLMRERVQVRGQIATLVSEPKLSGRILSLLPVVVYLGLTLIAPDYVKPLTTTGIGRIMLMVGAVMVVIGYFLMMQIADVDY